MPSDFLIIVRVPDIIEGERDITEVVISNAALCRISKNRIHARFSCVEQIYHLDTRCLR